ncbi:MAG: PA0069 family radical SAM protein [Planctomycetota bacterium]|nr:PA0069 family radical SAM protein [Planctomycetota bacterium]
MRHGSYLDPPNRFEKTHSVPDFTDLEWDTEYLRDFHNRKIEYIADDSKSIVSENNSPDIRFRYSVNPYRGCIHACAYCYARPSHEFLGYNAGLDFETKIVVKERAPKLFRDWLARDAWEPELIVFSGVTDCYQPAERKYQLTRGCLEVALEARQPVGIITKNALVLRDLDLLTQMSAYDTVGVSISITTLDESLARTMEPRTSTPQARLRAIRELTSAGVRTRVMVAPIIPGLNDSEIPAILAAAAAAGAESASYTLLRLPLNVLPIFSEWLERTQPLKKDRVESRIRSTRDGQLSDAKFGRRMRGAGEIAEQIEQMFRVFAKKHGLDQKHAPLATSHFTRPIAASGQLRLF